MASFATVRCGETNLFHRPSEADDYPSLSVEGTATSVEVIVVAEPTTGYASPSPWRERAGVRAIPEPPNRSCETSARSRPSALDPALGERDGI